MLKWVFAAALFIATNNVVEAASAKKISRKKRVVQVDAGTEKGFVKGEKVCFFSKKKKKVACGKVLKAKKASSFVRVSKKRIKRIKKGFEAVLASAGKSGTPPDARHSFVMRGFWAAGILPPVTYQKLAYMPPSGAAAESLWEASGPADGLLVGGGLEAEMPSWSTAVGFRYRLYQAVEFTTDYVKPADNFFVEGTLSGSSIGFYADYYMLEFIGMQVGAGLDIDMNTVTMQATLKDDDGKQEDIVLADVTSTLTAISIRVPIRYNLAFGAFGMSFGLNAMIPLAGEATTTSVINDEQNSTKISTTPEEDLAFVLAHSKNSIAIELIGGLYMGF